MPGINFNTLRVEIAIKEVLDLLGFQATHPAGDQLRGPCPVHGSTSARSQTFSVNLSTGRYQCFKCGSKGNQLELWAEVKRIKLYDAAIDRCNALGREVPWIHRW